MHCFTMFNTMHTPGCDIVDTLKLKDKKRFRQLCISLILGTDLKEHFPIVGKFSSKVEDLKYQLQTKQKTSLQCNEELKELEMSLVLKV